MTTGRHEQLRTALLDDPATDHLHQRDSRALLRGPIADLTAQAPTGSQLDDLNTLMAVVLPEDGLPLSEREWLETVLAAERLINHLHALKLAAVAGLDTRLQQTKPATRHRRDSRRPAADALAPALKLAPGSASALVGLARQSLSMPAASDALAEGLMTYAQFTVLARVLARMPDPDARAQVEAIAVRKAATAVRAQLADIVEEAAVQADPGYTARTRALGIEERDVRLAPSPVPGCQRVIADLERSDAARFWQVLNTVATRAKATPLINEATGKVVEEERLLPQLRADAVVSLVVGMFSLISDDPEGETEGEQDPDLPVDTRAPVRIPTPQERAKLAELHVVVLADDLADDPDDDPDNDPGADPDEPDDGPGAEPDGDHDIEDFDDEPDEPDERGGRLEPSSGPTDAGNSSAPGTGTDPRADARRRHRTRSPRGPRRSRSLSRVRPMGWLPGYGRLDPVTTAAVIERAPWRRLVADPTTGVLVQRSPWVIDPGDRRERLALLLALPANPPPQPEVHYRPSSGLAAFVRARDATCIGPACHHAARSGGMQLDHTVAWGPDTATRLRGGATAHGNLGCVCVRAHDAKTHGGWGLTQPRPGWFTWTSPQGLVFHRRAVPLVPDLLGDLASDLTGDLAA